MPAHDIIVVGASAGGVEVLDSMVQHLPKDLPAAIFVAMHVSPRSKSFLPEILGRRSLLPVAHAQNGASITPGRIYVAPPDCHLVLEPNHVHLTRGPKEQHQRPSINVLFRSAALAYKARVIGVILSGELDDGTAGLWEIERRGGITVVQNPEEAAFPSMPLSALREIEVDYTVLAGELGALLSNLASDKDQGAVPENGQANRDFGGGRSQLTDLTCPECRGTIWEVQRGNGKDYRCRVGHTYSAKSMLASHFSTQEKALYSAIVALEEGASLADRLADQFDPEYAQKLRAEAHERHAQADTIRQVLKDRLSFEI